LKFFYQQFVVAWLVLGNRSCQHPISIVKQTEGSAMKRVLPETALHMVSKVRRGCTIPPGIQAQWGATQEWLTRQGSLQPKHNN